MPDLKHHLRMYESSDCRIASFPNAPANVTFQRSELAVIMPLYGRMVAAGEWRDYGISHLREAAVFSAFRHTQMMLQARDKNTTNPRA